MTADEHLKTLNIDAKNMQPILIYALVEFAKMHVEEALKAVYEQNEEILDKTIINNSYPLTNIK